MAIKVRNTIFLEGSSPVIEAISSLEKVLPFSAAWECRKLLRQLATVHQDFVTDRAAINEDCILKDENGENVPLKDDKGEIVENRFQIDPEKVEEFGERMNELLNHEEEYNINQPRVELSEKVKEKLEGHTEELMILKDWGILEVIEEGDEEEPPKEE